MALLREIDVRLGKRKVSAAQRIPLLRLCLWHLSADANTAGYSPMFTSVEDDLQHPPHILGIDRLLNLSGLVPLDGGT
jgi:hypothetical protein